ncbi:MAG: portal protein [Dehalococcoidales bacterium]
MAANVKEIIRTLQDMKTDRENHDIVWQQIADHILPRAAEMTTIRHPGVRRRGFIYDSDPESSLERFASGIHNTMTGEGLPWFYLRAEDENIREDRSVKEWLEAATRRLYTVFNSPSTRFHATVKTMYEDLGAFGNGIMFIGDRPGRSPMFKTHFIGEIWYEENEEGIVDTVFREWEWPAKKIIQKWGKDALPAGTQRRDFTIIHVVRPRKDRVAGRKDRANMPFESVWILRLNETILDEGGFRDFPYIVDRWDQFSGEMYGRGPGHRALADVMSLNAIEKTNLKVIQQEADPALDVPKDGYANRIRTWPGALNYRKSTTQANEGVRPIMQGRRVDLSEAKAAQKREAIRRHFYLDIFELEGPVAGDGDVIRMSATEAAIRQREKLSILGPIFSRQKQDFLGPLIFRTLGLMILNNLLPPAPPTLVDAEVEAEYVSPLAIAQEAGDVRSILEAVETMRPFAEIDPSVHDIWNKDNVSRVIADRLRVPIETIRPEEEVQQARAQQAQDAAAEQAAALAESQARTLKDTAGAAAQAEGA